MQLLLDKKQAITTVKTHDAERGDRREMISRQEWHIHGTGCVP
jgi:hypothetical protein